MPALTTGQAEASFDLAARRPARVSVAKQTDIDMSPLADMVFQLLAFFIMTVKLASQETVDVPTISHGKGLDVDKSTVITVFAPSETSPEPRLFLGFGSEMTPINYDQIKDIVLQGLSAGKGDVIIKAERLTPWGFVERAMQEVAATDASLYIGVKDEE